MTTSHRPAAVARGTRRTVTRVSAFTAVIALSLGACGPGPAAPSGKADATDRTTPSEAVASGTSAGVPTLDGTWETGPVDCAQQEAALKRAGFTEQDLQIGGWEADGPCVTKSLAVRIEDGRGYFLEPDGSVGWYVNVQILDDHRMETRTPAGDFLLTLDYTLDEDRLTVQRVTPEERPEPGSDAHGDLIAATQSWTSAPFLRRDTAGSTPGTGPVAYVASRYPVSFSLPAGWSIEADAEEAFFVSPDGSAWLTLDTGEPAPDDTVADRVRFVQEVVFSGCDFDPTSDRTVSLGGEDAIVWSATCGGEANLSVQAIHGDRGYRLTFTTAVSSEDQLAAHMAGLIDSFAFTD